MARKNIFDQMKTHQNFQKEIQRIEQLLQDGSGIIIETVSKYITDEPTRDHISIEKFVDVFAFKDWDYRGTCINCEDLRESLNLEELLNEYYNDPKIDEILNYAEYVANILYLVKTVELKPACTIIRTPVLSAVRKNLVTLLDWLNYEQKTFKTKKRVLVVEKNASATAVAEIVDDDLAYRTIQYNHNMLKGNIAAKKSILLAMGAELEPKRKEIKAINKDLEDSIFFMLNNVELRHNNGSENDKNYKEFVAKMSKKTLEQWYDELYQMMLIAFLELDQQGRMIKISKLKNDITN